MDNAELYYFVLKIFLLHFSDCYKNERNRKRKPEDDKD